jgi:hypothetical protein
MTSSRRITVLAIVCMAASLIIALVTAARIHGPSIRPDEWGYLLNGQVLIGHEEVRLPFSSMYPAGFGLITGAWAWVGGSLHAAYRLTLFTNIALMAVLGYLVFTFTVNTLKASRTTGYLVSALVIASPGTLAGSLFALPETLCKVVFMLLVVLIGSMVSRPRMNVVVLFGAVAGFAPIFSSRLVAITVSAVVVLIALAWNGIVSRSAALLGAGSLVAGYVITRSMNSIVRDALYFGRRSGESRILDRAFTVHLWPEVIREIAGQIWYVCAATACLGLVGLAVMVRAVARKARAYKRSDEQSPERFSYVFILMTFAFLIVLGALQLALGKRADHYIYGRYVEMCVPALFAVACVALERTKTVAVRFWRWSIVFFAFLTAMYVLLVGADVVWRAISIDGPMRTANVLAIDALSHAVRRPGLLTMTPVLCAVSIAVVYLYMRKKEVALIVLASLLLGSSAWTASSTLINRSSPDRGVGVALQSVSHSDSSRVAYDGLKPQDRNYYTLRYAAHPSLIVWVDTRTENRIPESFSCLYGYEDRRPVDGEWEIVGRETSIERVLWRRVGQSVC